MSSRTQTVASDRRRALAVILGCGACCALPRLVLAQQYGLPPYCALDAGFDLNRISHRSSSGNPRLDRAMIAEVRKINRVFSIRPGYRFFDDGSSGNALATTRTVIQNTRGSVFFGLGLLQSELAEEFGGAAVAGIAAHEGAHILQFFSSFGHRLAGYGTARNMELHADFLAGYYFGAIGRTERSIDAFGGSLFEKGDYGFNAEDHHGTPEERLEAMHFGYREASHGAGLAQAIEAGLIHVGS